MLLQKNIVKKYLALLPDEQTQEAWKWVREPSLDPSLKPHSSRNVALMLCNMVFQSEYVGNTNLEYGTIVFHLILR